jgi:uncharacterized protein YndB with AHSA1/START domain
MPTQSGHLVLADISGYTSFVADTELEHSREILNELLETLVRGLAQRLRIGQIEGDAIFALGESIGDDPQVWLEDIFIRFHRHLNAIKRVSTCPCKACVSVGSLTLKYICHWGEYLPQSFLGKETFVGNAVNQVHRLLKNKVPSREYLLVTKETLDRLPSQMRGLFTPHREEYDLGAVECGWMDLAPLRNDPRTDEKVKVVDADHAELSFERVYDAPKDRLWALLTDPAARQAWMGVERMDYEPGARNTMVGAEYHCIHGQGESSVFRIMEAKRPAQMTMAMQFGPALVWNTVTLEELDGARTKVTSLYHFEVPPGVPEEMRAMGTAMLSEYEAKYVPKIEELIERGVAAAPPAG